MKALTYLDKDVAQVVERDVPELADSQALVKVHASGVCGTDVAIWMGTHPRAKAPLVLGHEFAGEVVEICGDADDISIGDGDHVAVFPLLWCGRCWACRHGASHVCRTLRMIGIDRDGGFAEYAVAPLDLLCKLPDDLPWDLGALIEPLAVGVHAVEMGDVAPDDATVVMGAGPIGLITALCLRDAGVERITLTEMHPYRIALARRLGFDTLDLGECDAVEAVRDATGGDGADVVFEVAGSAPAAMQMTELARSRGKIVVVSVHKRAHEVDLRSVNFKELTLVGTRVYERKDFDKAIELARRLPLAELVSHRLPLERAAEGLPLMVKGGDVCKVIVELP